MYLLNSAFQHCKSKLRTRYPVDSCHFGQCEFYPKGSTWKIMVKTLNVTFKECQILLFVLLSWNSKTKDNLTQQKTIQYFLYNSHLHYWIMVVHRSCPPEYKLKRHKHKPYTVAGHNRNAHAETSHNNI